MTSTTTTTIPAPRLAPRTAAGMALAAFVLGGVLTAAVVVNDGSDTAPETVRPSISGTQYEDSADARRQSSAAYESQLESPALERSISAIDHAEASGANPSVLHRSISAIDHADAK